MIMSPLEQNRNVPYEDTSEGGIHGGTFSNEREGKKAISDNGKDKRKADNPTRGLRDTDGRL
jgi:hypothetical protein